MNSKSILIFSVVLLSSFCYAQPTTKSYNEKGQKNPTTIETGMYEDTKSPEARVQFENGLKYFDKQDYKNAEKCFRKATEIDNRYVEAYDNLGIVYRRLGNIERALECYKKSIELYPSGAIAHQNLAVIYMGQRDLEKAAKEYNEYIRLEPSSAEGYYGLANAQMGLGKIDDAFVNANKALEIYETENSPLVIDAQNILGILFYYKGEKEEAKKYLGIVKKKGYKIHPQIEKELKL